MTYDTSFPISDDQMVNETFWDRSYVSVNAMSLLILDFMGVTVFCCRLVS